MCLPHLCLDLICHASNSGGGWTSLQLSPQLWSSAWLPVGRVVSNRCVVCLHFYVSYGLETEMIYSTCFFCFIWISLCASHVCMQFLYSQIKKRWLEASERIRTYQNNKNDHLWGLLNIHEELVYGNPWPNRLVVMISAPSRDQLPPRNTHDWQIWHMHHVHRAMLYHRSAQGQVDHRMMPYGSHTRALYII